MNRRIGGRLAILGKWQFLAVVGAAVLGYFVVSFGGLVVSGYQLSQRVSTLQREVQELRGENALLEGNIRALASDGAVEKLAREQLGWAKPGETAIVVVPSRSNASPSPTPPTSEPRLETPGWRHWLDFLFGG